MFLGVLAFAILGGRSAPPPAEIAGDPTLVQGWEVYQKRCVACHGPNGEGSGAENGPDGLNFRDGSWKQGRSVEEVLKVVTDGLPKAGMPAYRGLVAPEEAQAVSTYVARWAIEVKAPETPER